MAKSKKRGGAKAHRKRVKSRNEKIKGKQNQFVKQFEQKLAEARAEQEAKEEPKELDGTEVRTMDSTMSAPPVK
jgi:hypothetical protein